MRDWERSLREKREGDIVKRERERVNEREESDRTRMDRRHENVFEKGGKTGRHN